MDSTRQALQTKGKLFSNFGIIFRISYAFGRANISSVAEKFSSFNSYISSNRGEMYEH